jgi:hypothetical protein
MYFWHLVAIGCLDCPNVCSTMFVSDAVYANVSGLGILDHSQHVDVFLNSNVDSLGTKVSMQPADLVEFRYCYGSMAAMFVGFLLCTCGLFRGQGLLDNLMTTTNFLLTLNTYRIKKS